jgi:hypothetical protein
VHVQEALQENGDGIPSCCGKPLPGDVLETVLQKEEVEVLTNSALRSPGTETIRDSGYCEKGISVVDLTRPLEIVSEPPTSTSLPLPPSRRRHEAISIDAALANEAFTTFRSEEKEQFERVSAFECNQRKALLAHHRCSLIRLAARQNAIKDEKTKQVSSNDIAQCYVSLLATQHVHDLEHLEELQIIAEHDLRKAHGMEGQNVATALKHMEAYCLGSGQSHPDHYHTVTEEDFNKLDRQRTIQEKLPRKHENAINVLRARQERDIKNRIHKQQTDLLLMDEAHANERAAEEAEHAKEIEKLDAIIEARRKRLLQRWDLKFEMWRKDWEAQHGTAVTMRLEHELWPLHTTKTTTPIPESSSLAPYVQVAA